MRTYGLQVSQYPLLHAVKRTVSTELLPTQTAMWTEFYFGLHRHVVPSQCQQRKFVRIKERKASFLFACTVVAYRFLTYPVVSFKFEQMCMWSRPGACSRTRACLREDSTNYYDQSDIEVRLWETNQLSHSGTTCWCMVQPSKRSGYR